MRITWSRFIRTENVFLAALLVSTTLLLVQQGWLWRLDQFIYDVQLKTWQRPVPDDIVIIAIDETSIEKLGNWPWETSYFTRLLLQIAQNNPHSVSFHFPLPLSDSNTHEPDQKLIDALRNVSNPMLPVTLAQHSDIAVAEKLSDYLALHSNARTGHINVIQDQDGFVRSTYLAEGVTSRIWKNLNMQLTGQTYGKHVSASSDRNVQQTRLSNEQEIIGYEQMLIPFSGPPGHFQSIPYYKILSGDYLPGHFNNKYVLIGITDTSIGRSYPTPNNGYFNPMSLVEINANIVNSILNSTIIRPASHTWNLAFSGIFALLPFLLYPLFTPRTNVILTLTLVATAVTINFLLVRYFNLWIPLSAALLALILSYLLWSSRRLANAVNYLNEELAELNAKQASFGNPTSSKLETVLSFLGNIMPIAGWRILDSSNKLVTDEGNPPDLPNKQLVRGHWTDDGLDYWAMLTINHVGRKIGVRWKNSSGPSDNEKDYLNNLLKQIHEIPVTNNSNSNEAVQNLIQQLQEAIVKLRNTHKFLDESLTQMADAILVTNQIGQIQLMNDRAATYLQIEPNETLTGKDISQLLNGLVMEGNVTIDDMLAESIIKGLPASAHVRNQAGLDLLLQMTPLSRSFSSSGNVIFNLSDISHLKSVERARNETLSFVSHDLRSPLVSILALLELAKNRESSDEIQELHRRIDEYTQLTISLAEQFIQLARVESEASIKLDTIDMISIAINAQEQTWVQAQAKNIHLKREINLDHAWVRGNSGLLERAVSNLLNNAIKYSPDDCCVLMKIFRRNSNVWCCIEDNGYGIPENELPTLFERFHRAHLNSGVDQKGIGLGLALVKATAERHGGYMDVQSEEGEGSRFCLVLPETELDA